MVLNECLILKENKILVLKNNNKWELPSIEVDDHEDAEFLLKKHMKDKLGISIDIIQIFNTYQILKNEKNVNVNIYEASLLNGKIDSKEDGEVNFLSVEELNKSETSETLKLVMDEL